VSPPVATLAAGTRGVSITGEARAVGDARTLVDLVAGAERRTLAVVVGRPAPEQAPFTIAPPVGACVDDPVAPPERRCP
jgi:hypothetical protein